MVLSGSDEAEPAETIHLTLQANDGSSHAGLMTPDCKQNAEPALADAFG